MAPIERITLFKIPNEADRDRVLEQYKVLAKTAVKVCFFFPSFLSFPLFCCSKYIRTYISYYTPCSIRRTIQERASISTTSTTQKKK